MDPLRLQGFHGVLLARGLSGGPVLEYYIEGKVSFREYYDLEIDAEQLTNLLGNDDPNDDPDVDALLRGAGPHR